MYHSIPFKMESKTLKTRHSSILHFYKFTCTRRIKKKQLLLKKDFLSLEYLLYGRWFTKPSWLLTCSVQISMKCRKRAIVGGVRIKLNLPVRGRWWGWLRCTSYRGRAAGSATRSPSCPRRTPEDASSPRWSRHRYRTPESRKQFNNKYKEQQIYENYSNLT